MCSPSKVETVMKTPLNESTRSKSDGELETPRIRHSLINKTPRTPTPLKISDKVVLTNNGQALVSGGNYSGIVAVHACKPAVINLIKEL